MAVPAHLCTLINGVRVNRNGLTFNHKLERSLLSFIIKSAQEFFRGKRLNIFVGFGAGAATTITGTSWRGILAGTCRVIPL